jgi:hypothetical protein
LKGKGNAIEIPSLLRHNRLPEIGETHMRRFVSIAIVLAATFTAVSAQAQNKPLLAVMDIQDKTGQLSAETIDTLTEYLRGMLAESGKYTVIDRSRQAKAIKAILQKERKETHKACYERSCQVPVGRILAADQVLLTTFMKAGSKFLMKAEIIRLDTEASTGGATARGQFAPKQSLEDRVIEALDTIAAKVSGQSSVGSSGSETVRPVSHSIVAKTPPAKGQSTGEVTADKLAEKARYLQDQANHQKKEWQRVEEVADNDRLPVGDRVAAIEAFGAKLEKGSYYAKKATKLRSHLVKDATWMKHKTEWIGVHLTVGAVAANFAGGLHVNLLTWRGEKFYFTTVQGGFGGGPSAFGASVGFAFGFPVHLGSKGTNELRFESDVDVFSVIGGADGTIHGADGAIHRDEGMSKSKVFWGTGLTPRLLYVNHFSKYFSFVTGVEIALPLVPWESSDFVVAPAVTLGLKLGM